MSDDSLHRAAAGGDVAEVRRLLAAGADANAVDATGTKTPLIVAAKSRVRTSTLSLEAPR